MRTEPTLDSIDLSNNDLFRHGFPHEVFSFLREEAPIWQHPITPGIAELGSKEFWVISDHADVVEISHKPELFRSFEGPRLTGWEPERRGQMLITMDPPEHTRLRRLVASGFTPRRVAMLDEQAREWAVKIVDSALEKGEMNFVHEVAFQLPMQLIADMVGIPVADREELFAIVNKMLYALDQDAETFLSDEERKALEIQLFMYGRALGDAKRRNPTDDVWTTLTTAEITLPDGEVTKLNEMELDLFFMVLAVAGSETTRNSISSGLIALLENPDQLELMRNDLTVFETAADEIIRWASPVTYFRRTAVEDTELNGAQIKAGDPVTLWFPSANRDEKAFADASKFDITRKPNPHVALGAPGPHHCLGATLARREIKVMFQELIARVGTFEQLGEPVYSVGGIVSPVSFSMKDLPVRLTQR